MDLKDQLIKLGSQNPELQNHLKPVLDHLEKSSGRVPRKYQDTKEKFRNAVSDILASTGGSLSASEIVRVVSNNNWKYNIPDDHVEFIQENKGTLLKQMVRNGEIEKDGLKYDISLSM
jgi:hypothetical protein